MKITKFTKNHEWIRLEKDNSVTIGITDRAQHTLGDIVFVEQPERGTAVIAGQECALVESTSSAIDVTCPTSGEVIDTNDNVANFPHLLNQNPEGDGWLFKIKPSKTTKSNNLLTLKEYKKYLLDTGN